VFVRVGNCGRSIGGPATISSTNPREDIMGDLLQLSVLLGAAAVGLRAVTRLVVAVWSLRADPRGRRYALRLIKALDRE
jgi:hypothetical protein